MPAQIPFRRRARALPLAWLCLSAAAFLGPVACSLTDSGSELLNVASVKFSEGSPAVDGQSIDYQGGLLQTPSLDKFVLKMVFHVKADNSANTGTASFGSSAVKPILLFRVNSKSSNPISTPIPAFSIPGGTTADLNFPVEVPLTSIDQTTLRKIAAGDPIPYFLSGTLAFDVLDGASILGKGKAEIDLASGEIATRPSGTAANLLPALL